MYFLLFHNLDLLTHVTIGPLLKSCQGFNIVIVRSQGWSPGVPQSYIELNPVPHTISRDVEMVRNWCNELFGSLDWTSNLRYVYFKVLGR